MLNVIESMSDLKANVVSIGAILEQIEKINSRNIELCTIYSNYIIDRK